jgi:hypothetical protein
MKYLKFFENKILDEILDKISDNGEKDLTSWEREYLAAFDTPKQKEMEEELNKPPKIETEEEISSMSIDDIINSEEMGDDKEIEMYWEKLTDEEINDFMDRFGVQGDYATKRWEELPNELKNVFIQYLIQMGYLKR